MNQFAADESLLKQFEGREAIYIEKGALRVRVFNIRLGNIRFEPRSIIADVEELPTPGLGFAAQPAPKFDEIGLQSLWAPDAFALGSG